MILFSVTVLALIALYLLFIFVFPKAVPTEAEERTQNALRAAYEVNRQSLEQEEEVSIASSYDDESHFVRSFFSVPIIKDLYPLILRAGLRDNADIAAYFYILATFIVFVVFASSISILLALIAAPIVAYFLMKIFLERKIKRRNAIFIDQFPDVLDMFVRSLKSGFPVATAFRTIVENMEAPVSTEFERVVREQAMGQSVSASLSRLAERIDEPDIHFFVVVMRVQQETGGNLMEVISNLSNVIRKRKQLRHKIKAMTSEGRATAYILGSLPVFVFGVFSVIAPDYVEIFWTETIGMVWLGVAATLVLACMFVINKMIAIDI